MKVADLPANSRGKIGELAGLTGCASGLAEYS
jgi:hypothetical protein